MIIKKTKEYSADGLMVKYIMSRIAKGIAHNISTPIIGIIERSLNENNRDNLNFKIKAGYSSTEEVIAIMVEGESEYNKLNYSQNIPRVELKSELLEMLCDDDIVMINPSGYVNILFKANSHQNYLFVTEKCNSNCLMCPQPPRMRDDIEYYYDINMKVIDLIPKDTPILGITGGEPTLLGEKLYNMMSNISARLSHTEIHILTNGRALAWVSNVQRLAGIPRQSVIYAISLHSDYEISHDYQAQDKHAFAQSLLGIHNLGRYDRRVEIRIIMNKINASRLSKIAEFIYRNMPFVEHVAFMGLELMGFCKMNIKKLWVNPNEYIGQLREAALMLAQHRMAVSIYNLPLCVLPDDLQEFSKKSISEWKRKYPDECAECKMISKCGGIFNSWDKVSSGIISPILS